MLPLLSLIVSLALPPATLAAPDPELPPYDRRVTLGLGISDQYPSKSKFRSCLESGALSQHHAAGSSSTGEAGDDSHIPFSFEPCPLLAYLKAKVRPLDPSIFQALPGRVTYFGETHIDNAGKNFVASLLPTLKSQGYNTLAMEMFEAEDQPVLDAYFENRADIEIVRKTLKSKWFYEDEGYIRLIQSAQSQNMRILALDDRKNPDKDSVKDFARRDRFMAGKLLAYLALNPDAKVVAFTGSLHAQCQLTEDGSMLTQVEILSQYGVEANCFSIRDKKRSGIFRRAMDVLGFTNFHFFPLPRAEAFSDGQIVFE